jgi:NAD(P)-dependent dehydrogenase (short-subunit alcohol dehydrogenase family)
VFSQRRRKQVQLKGKVVAITGAGRGIGLAAAELFAQEGASVILLEIDEESGRKAERSIVATGGKALFIQTDVSNAAQVESAFSNIERLFGGLHVLYNNASIFLRGQDGPVSELSIETWQRIIGTNLNGVFHCCRVGIPLIIRSGGGSVVSTSSSAAVIGVPRCDAYTASKGAIIALTRSMAVEYGPSKVRVNCIAPAAIRTEMVWESNLDDPDFDEARFLAITPVRRWGTPDEIASIALFLASDASSYLNGAVIVSDGGSTVTFPFNRAQGGHGLD